MQGFTNILAKIEFDKAFKSFWKAFKEFKVEFHNFFANALVKNEYLMHQIIF